MPASSADIPGGERSVADRRKAAESRPFSDNVSGSHHESGDIILISSKSITLASAVTSYIQEVVQHPRIQPYIPQRLQQYLPQKQPPPSPLTARIKTALSELQREVQQRFGQTPVQQPPASASPIVALASTYPIYTTALLAVLLYLLLTNLPIMSWASRFGGWSGKFSPFGRDPQNAKVEDADFSYITSDDLRRNLVPPTSGPRPNKDTDVLVLKHRKISYPIHFPRDSIDRGELTIGELRSQAAKKTGVADPRRIKLFYKGRNMSDDNRLAREEGLRSDLESEILCAVGEAAPSSESGTPTAETLSAGSDDEDDAEDIESAVNGATSTAAGGKKKRKHRKRKSRKGGASGTSTPPTSTGTHTPTAEFLGIPSAPPPRPTSAPAVPKAADSPLDKLDAIASTFHTKFVPDCVQLMTHPPADKAKRDFEYKRLSEMILAQVLLKLDSVETEGVEGAREKRKALVKEVQAMLNRLDEVAKQ